MKWNNMDNISRGQLAAFIPGACFIDALAGFYAGVTQQESERRGSGKISDFAGTYMTKYGKIEALAPIHFKQLLSYLRLTDYKPGLLINFNEVTMKKGIHRAANKL